MMTMMLRMGPLPLLTIFASLMALSHAWSIPKLPVIKSYMSQSRREVMCTWITSFAWLGSVPLVLAEDQVDTPPLALASPTAIVENDVEVVVSGAAKSIFNEGRAYEMQGNMAAAQRLYVKTTKISPRVRTSVSCS